MVLKIPPPPPIANQNPAFNRWLVELQSLLNGIGQVTAQAVTQPNGTNTTDIATCAFVLANVGSAVPSNSNPLVDGVAAPGVSGLYSRYDHVHPASTTPSNSNPLVDGTATPGTSTTYSRGDHVHPTDTTRAPLASPTFTGTPTAPTPAASDNSTTLATTAYFQSQSQVRNGSGVPAAGLGNNGDLYLNNTGGAGTRLYGKISGAWVAIA